MSCVLLCRFGQKWVPFFPSAAVGWQTLSSNDHLRLPRWLTRKRILIPNFYFACVWRPAFITSDGFFLSTSPSLQQQTVLGFFCWKSLLFFLPGVVIEVCKGIRKCLSDVGMNGTRGAAAHAHITIHARGLFWLMRVQYSWFNHFSSIVILF